MQHFKINSAGTIPIGGLQMADCEKPLESPSPCGSNF